MKIPRKMLFEMVMSMHLAQAEIDFVHDALEMGVEFYIEKN